MTRTHIALAVALAVSFGVIRPTLSPIREVPLSKSDILIADNTSEQGLPRWATAHRRMMRMGKPSMRGPSPTR